jgi:ABC-type dipeptide/oligopeptide/nickel transport system ATPase component
MIKNINIKDVRWISLDITAKKINCISWKNATGKSTIVQLIRDLYRWKTSIRKWEVTIIDSNKNTLISKNWKLFWWIWLADRMLLMTPWFLMGNQTIVWINKTKEDKRKTISELLWIDRDWFFEKHGVDYSIKWLNQELRDLNTTEIAYWEQLIETENQLKDLVEVKEIKEIKLIEWNENELDLLKDRLSNLWNEEELKGLFAEIPEVKLIEWNEKELERLKSELNQIVLEWKNIPTVCDKCWQEIKDSDKQKWILRDKYKDKVKEIKEFKLVKSNLNEYNEYKEHINKLNNRLEENKRIIESNKLLEEKKTNLEKQIKEFKLVKWNREEYIEYTNSSRDYIEYKTKKESLEKRKKELEEKIKSFNSKEIEDKINKYKETEKKFIEWVSDKLVLWDLKIIFYKERKTPNSDGDMYSSEFNIEYKWKLYNELSWWERWVVDIILASIFITSYNVIDFIVIDNAEISEQNIKKVIKDYLSDLQVFYTKIDNKNLEVK